MVALSKNDVRFLSLCEAIDLENRGAPDPLEFSHTLGGKQTFRESYSMFIGRLEHSLRDRGFCYNSGTRGDSNDVGAARVQSPRIGGGRYNRSLVSSLTFLKHYALVG
jgi:hypothetical protein